MSSGQDIIVCDHIWKRYGAYTALHDISLTVRHGEVVCIVGPSGGGKSTFLRTLNGLEGIDEGSIDVHGLAMPGSRADLERIRRDVGMVFQNFNLFPHLTIRRNLTIAPMRARGVSHAEANARAERLLERVGILNQIDKYPQQLSGGQQQRVAIARALAMEPQVMLFDEPTSALDPEMVGEVLQVMRELAQSGMTMIIVTHEMQFAREVASRVLFMAEGRVLIDQPPTPFFTQVTEPRLKSFLSRMN